MRRRQPPPPAVGTLEPFIPAKPWTPQVWEAYVHWRAELDAYERAHPEHAEAVAAVREASIVPDSPFDPSQI